MGGYNVITNLPLLKVLKYSSINCCLGRYKFLTIEKILLLVENYKPQLFAAGKEFIT